MNDIKPAVYEIKTFDDFLKLPDRIIDEALAEFVETMKTAHATYQLTKTLARVSGVLPEAVLMKIPSMRFVDDGKKTITLNLQAKKEASHDDK